MMYDLFKIFNMDEFLSLELSSRTIVAVLEGRGRASILISRGCIVSMTFDDTYLPVNLLDEPVYKDNGYASYIDESGDVYLGIEVVS